MQESARWINYSRLKEAHPYIRLMRLDKPIGIWLTLLPALWALTLASKGSDIPLSFYLIFTVGAVLLRSAGCIINDMIDRELDAKVERTRNRPLANGELKLKDASALLILLLFASWMLLTVLPTPVIWLGIGAVIPIILYPFTKRFTYWPQLFLGLTFNWGVLMGWVAIRESFAPATFLLYAAAVLWTVGYDTIYAHQDREDDLALGMKSTALKFGNSTKKFLYITYGLSFICLWLSGIAVDIGLFYYITLLFAVWHLFWQVRTLDINSPRNCLIRFRSNRFFGLMVLVGILGGTWLF